MNPEGYDDEFIIDLNKDGPVFPDEIPHGMDILASGVYDPYDFDDGYVDFPEIDFHEFRDHY